MPDLDLAAESDGEVAARRGEGEGGYVGSEGEVVEDDAARHTGQDRLAVLVDREQEVALGGEADPRDILAVGEGEGVGLVAGRTSAHMGGARGERHGRKGEGAREYRGVLRNGRAAYSTRLKTVTRLPTGEKRWVPSGLKSRLPWQ